MGKIYHFTDPVKASGGLLTGLKILIAAEASVIAGSLYQVKVLLDVKSQKFSTVELLREALAGSDSFTSITGTFQLVMWIVCTVMFFLWLYRSAANAQYWKIANISQKPHWGFWNFIIPVWYLFKPYIFIRELWNCTEYREDAPHKWTELPAPACLKVWWFLFLLTSFIGRIIFRASMKTDPGIDDFIISGIFLCISRSLAIIETWMLIMIVNGIRQRQISFAVKQSLSPANK